MKSHRLQSVICAGLLGACCLVSAQENREDYVSLASHVIGTYQPTPNHSAEAIADSAQAFIDSLGDHHREQLLQPLDTEQRRDWTNLPARPDADGVKIGRLNEDQVKAACDLMANLFSTQGYRKICHIMLADDQLLNRGRRRPGFGSEEFSIVIFGEPSATQPWGFQLDGHHVGVNVSLNGESMTLSPSFIGTQPEAFKIGIGDEIRPIGEAVDLGYAFVQELSDEQRIHAVLRPKRGQILTGPGHDNETPEMVGLPCKTLTESQRAMLLKLIGQWVNDLPEAQARARMQELEAELEEMHFSWNGETEPGSDISWRIQGPSLIIEYACQDLGGDPLNHLHTMYRNPQNEYGLQLGSRK